MTVAVKTWNKRNLWNKLRLQPTDYITVCGSCLQASCWLGEFYCDDYKTASIVNRTVRDLVKLNREHPSYWAKSRVKRTELDDGPDSVTRHK